jgi:hypothetical protein
VELAGATVAVAAGTVELAAGTRVEVGAGTAAPERSAAITLE